jgi:hypothetical protein
MAFTSLKTLKDLEKNVPQQGKSGLKKYFSLQNGDSYKIRFRQELTEDSVNFDEKFGTAVVVPVVTSPLNWKWRIVSTATMPEYNYRCWGSEQINSDSRWRPRPHLLVNVAVDIDGTWEPRILDTTFNQRHVALIMMEYAKEFGTITDRYYKYSRTGTGSSDTNYTLIPLNQSEMPQEIASLPMHDLEKTYMTIPYEKQKSYLMTGELEVDGW